MLEIKEDIRDECAKVGTVTNVVLYDQETDGVASVRYSTVEAANACVRVIKPLFSSFQFRLCIQDSNYHSHIPAFTSILPLFPPPFFFI